MRCNGLVAHIDTPGEGGGKQAMGGAEPAFTVHHGWIAHMAYRAFARWTVGDFGLHGPPLNGISPHVASAGLFEIVRY